MEGLAKWDRLKLIVYSERNSDLSTEVMCYQWLVLVSRHAAAFWYKGFVFKFCIFIIRKNEPEDQEDMAHEIIQRERV